MRLASLLLSSLILASTATAFAGKAGVSKSSWKETFLAKAKEIDGGSKTIGLYVKDLSSGEEVSLRADEFWYIASGTKVPVALEVLREIDAGLIKLSTKVEVTDEDYIDGSGELNYIKPGSKVSVRLLLDQALTFSDNTATDILIRLVGLEKINELTQSVAPQSFTPITTLADVRRLSFSAFHPDAAKLPNMDLLRIKVAKGDKAKIETLAKYLKVSSAEFKFQDLDSAFESYYSARFNSATLRGYGLLLEKLTKGEVLKASTQRYLMDILERVETGEKRIKAGLPKNFVFAHKTGTQHRRYCDMGLLKDGTPTSKELIVVACVRQTPLKKAEENLSQIGAALYDSGVFSKGKKR